MPGVVGVSPSPRGRLLPSYFRRCRSPRGSSGMESATRPAVVTRRLCDRECTHPSYVGIWTALPTRAPGSTSMRPVIGPGEWVGRDSNPRGVLGQVLTFQNLSVCVLERSCLLSYRPAKAMVVVGKIEACDGFGQCRIPCVGGPADRPTYEVCTRVCLIVVVPPLAGIPQVLGQRLLVPDRRPAQRAGRRYDVLRPAGASVLYRHATTAE